MDQKIIEKLQAIATDADFMKELMAQDTLEKIQATLASKDIELSLEQVDELVKTTLAAANNNGNEELDENSLDNVAGGVIGPIIFLGLTAAGIGIGAWAGFRGCK